MDTRLNAQDVISINSARGIVFVKDGGKIVPRQLTLHSNGVLGCRPFEPPPIDQIGHARVPVEQRWAQADQTV